MSPFSDLWIPGAMPVQLLGLLTVTFLLVVAIQTVLKRMGRPIPPFWQVVGAWLVAYALLKWVVFPPFPGSLLAIYMGLISVVFFVWISATEQTWQEFKGYIFNILVGASLKHRVLRAMIVVSLPIAAGLIAYQTIVPRLDEPVELRISHPNPPRSITVHGEEFIL